MRMIEQTDFLKAAIAAAGVTGAQEIEVRDGQLQLDGEPYVLVPTAAYAALQLAATELHSTPAALPTPSPPDQALIL